MEREVEQPLYDAVRSLIEFTGEDADRHGLVDTPRRVVKALAEMTDGYKHDPARLLERVFPVSSNTLVVVSGIEFHSLCEHHMLPFFGTATIAYMPSGSVVGLSKLPRLVECFSKRLQVQERLTEQIASTVYEYIEPTPKGVGVMISARHLCMCARGIKCNANTMSSCAKGTFYGDADMWSTIQREHERQA